MSRGLPVWNMGGYTWILTLILMAFLVHNIWWLRDGIEMRGDSERYSESAQKLLDGQSIKGKPRGYIGYSAVLAMVKTITPQKYNYLDFVAGIQIIVATLAILCLFKIGQLIFSTPVGIIAAGISSINYIVVQWNHWILAESLFTSLLPISVLLCLKTAQKPYYSAIALPVVVFTAFVRPNGMLLLLVFLVYLFSLLKGRVKSMVGVVAVIMLAVAFLFAMEGLRDSGKNEAGVGMHGVVIMETERDGIKHYRVLDGPRLKEGIDNGLVGNLLFVYDNPLYSARLMGSRLYASYSLIRKDFSKRHNLFLYLVMPIYYIFVLIGVVVSIKKGIHKEHLLILGLVAGQSAIVAFSMADHDHRYFSYIVNLVTLYFSCGLMYLVDKFRNSRR